ncbi:Hint domain-containing protein, partial [Asaia prunellae]|uniref:Hint domain-containing protein n=1 Tax=Asaia prunellae TaxID=610245 RepID=UPI0004717B71
VSNDKIGDPSQVIWSNQSGAVPGSTAFPSFGGASTSLKLENAAGTESISYDRISGGVTSPGFYDPNAHFNMPCFLAGAMILTERGYCAVESLRLDDKIGVFLGSTVKWRPIKALSTGICHVSNDPFPDRAGYPVVIRKNAFGENKPNDDLRVTPDHAIDIDGTLFMARSLVDGAKIYFDKEVRSYSYYHIDLHDHHVIEANGLRVESLINHNSQSVFRNTVTQQNENFSAIGPARQIPLCTDPAKIESVRNRLDLQSCPAASQTGAPLSFRVFSDDGQELPFRSATGQKASFVVPAHVNAVKIVSEIARPYDAIGVHIEDRRKLGLLIGEITIYESSSSVTQKSHLEHQRGCGWSSLESDTCRWTAGEAHLKLDRHDPANDAIIAFDVLDDCARFLHYH